VKNTGLLLPPHPQRAESSVRAWVRGVALGRAARTVPSGVPTARSVSAYRPLDGRT